MTRPPGRSDPSVTRLQRTLRCRDIQIRRSINSATLSALRETSFPSSEKSGRNVHFGHAREVHA